MRASLNDYVAPGVLGRVGNVPYLGPVSTRTYFNDTQISSTAGWNCQTAHYARDDIVALRLIFSNNYVIPGTGETAQGGTSTTTASVVYNGTAVQATFNGGSTSIVIPSGATILSDLIPIGIPKGSLHLTRRFQVNSSKLLFVSNATTRKINTALGDAVASSSTDRTMIGGIVDSGGGAMIPPQGIIAYTKLSTIGAIGSSRMAGFKDTVVDASGNTGYTRMFGDYFAYMDYSVGGDTNASVSGSGGAIRRGLIKAYCSHLWLDPGLNDLNLGGTAAADLSCLSAMINEWPWGPSNVIVNDESAWTTSSDLWTTTTGQATRTTFEPQRVLLNAGIAALTGLNQKVIVSDLDGTGTNSQFWKNPVDGGSQTTPDGIHENSSQCIFIAGSGRFNPSLVRARDPLPVAPAGSSNLLGSDNAPYLKGADGNYLFGVG